jgi:hypothetical protein
MIIFALGILVGLIVAILVYNKPKNKEERPYDFTSAWGGVYLDPRGSHETNPFDEQDNHPLNLPEPSSSKLTDREILTISKRKMKKVKSGKEL